MSPSLQTMGFFMSDINFCNTKEQLNHLGEVVTGKVDGSPTGADIDTSTLPYTGQVRKTLPALEGEYEQSITNKEAEADAAIDEYRLLNKGPYAAGITLESKFEYITYNGESYFATNPPYTTTSTTPDADGNLFIGGYATQDFVNSGFSRSFYSVQDAIDNCPDVGYSLTVDDYYGGDFPNKSGVLFFKVVAAGTGTDDGGKYIDVDSTRQLEQNLKTPYNVKAWGARGGDDISLVVLNACNYLATINSFEKSTGLHFPGEIYTWSNQVNLNVSHGNISWVADGNCSFDIRNLASEHPLVVDFSTGWTANFLKFDMKNIHWTDTSLSYSRRGPHFKRVIGSRFVGCHFNYLAIPLAMDENSNLNTFDTCQFRGNTGRIVGYSGGANNNVFLNCQWRYNTATCFKALNTGDASFPGNFLETKFIGGDLEPGNVSPIMDISNTYIQNMRVERNNADVQLLLGDDNTIVDMAVHSDGGTQAIGARVTGRGNSIHFKYFSGQRAIEFTDSSRDNNYELGKTVVLTSGGNSLVYDLGDRNVPRVNGVAQTDGLMSYPMKKGYLVPRDLALWSVVGGSLTTTSDDGSWEFISDGSQANAYIYAQVIQNSVKDVIVGATIDPANLGGQSSVFINSNPVFDGFEEGIGGYSDTQLPPVRVYAQRNNYQDSATAINNPYVMIKMNAANGGSCRFKDIVVSTTAYSPSL